MFRRRRPRHPRAEQINAGFGRVATHVAAAQRALLAAVPKPRDDGEPIRDALDAFARSILRAQEGMSGWRDPATEALWQRCSRALEGSLEAAATLGRAPGPLPFEALNEAIGDVLAPLEEFVEADQAIRRL